MPLKADFKKKLIALLKKFKLEEFHLLLTYVFPAISLDRIHCFLDQFRCDLTPLNVAEVSVRLFEGSSPSLDDCDKAISQIYLFDAAFHNNLLWSAAELRNEVNALPEQLSDLNEIVMRSYRCKALNALVHSFLCKDIVWTVVAEKKLLKKGGVKMASPVFFAYKPDLDRPHIVYCPKSMDRNLHLQIYCESLGYSEYSLLDYEGRNAAAMMDCIQRRIEAASGALQMVPYDPGNKVVLRSNCWKDYSQAADRKKYAKKIFKTNSAHTYMTLECEELCADKRLDNSSCGSEFYSTMELQGGKKSVEDVLSCLVEMGAVDLPAPNYMCLIASTASNVISLNVSQTNN